MDRNYIESGRIVERYLSGDLTVREARAFEKYCLENPEFLRSMPIPVRLKARLARQPTDDSETGMFPAIPSSTARVALESGPDEAADEPASRHGVDLRQVSRPVLVGLAAALLIATATTVSYAMKSSELREQLRGLERRAAAFEMSAPGGVQRHRITPVRTRPENPTLVIGRPTPPQLLELYIDASQGPYTQFQLTLDRVDGTRVMQLRRLARDSNRELRLALNSSALDPGEYLLQIEGYTWRGQVQAVGWVRLGLE